MKRLGTILLVVGCLGLAGLFAPTTPSAAAAPTTSRQSTPLVAASRLRLDIASMSPRVVDVGSRTITITGTVTNIGDRKITSLMARLQVGTRLTSANQIQSALSTAPTAQPSGWTTIADELAAGQSAHLAMTVPLTGPNSLSISQPGVYPLMININGQPDYGGVTRLAAVNMLLPVLAAPGGQPASSTSPAAGMTLLWPLVDDRPRLVGNTANGQLILSDDDLAASLRPGGRLYGLLDAVATLTSPADAALRSSICFAVDPDLLATVSGMASGYQVRTASGGTTPGTGAAAAAAWLASLKTATAGHCVFALPYADADPVALARTGDAALAASAFGASSTVTRLLPDAQLVQGVAWPADGAIDGSTVATLSAALGGKHGTVLVAPNSVSPAATGPVRLTGTNLNALPIDEAVSGALGGSVNDTAGGVDTMGSIATPVNEQAISLQDGLAALAYRAVFDTSANRSMLITPPRRWNVSEAELRVFLQTAQRLLTAGFATPASLASLATSTDAPPAGTPTVKSVKPTYPSSALAAELPPSVTGEATRLGGDLRGLLDAMNKDHVAPAMDPNTLIDPLSLGLLQALSTAWRGGNTAPALEQLRLVDQQVTAIAGQVTVLPVYPVITLASKQSPIPVTVHNSLPVDITVRVNLSEQSGLHTGSADHVRVPAGGSVTVSIPASVTRTGRFSVQAWVSTEPDGIPVGMPARLELVSTAYGTIILVATGVAFGVLVLLAGRRIYRRIRSHARTAAEGPTQTTAATAEAPTTATVPTTAPTVTTAASEERDGEARRDPASVERDTADGLRSQPDGAHPTDPGVPRWGGRGADDATADSGGVRTGRPG